MGENEIKELGAKAQITDLIRTLWCIVDTCSNISVQDLNQRLNDEADSLVDDLYTHIGQLEGILPELDEHASNLEDAVVEQEPQANEMLDESNKPWDKKERFLDKLADATGFGVNWDVVHQNKAERMRKILDDKHAMDKLYAKRAEYEEKYGRHWLEKILGWWPDNEPDFVSYDKLFQELDLEDADVTDDEIENELPSFLRKDNMEKIKSEAQKKSSSKNESLTESSDDNQFKVFIDHVYEVCNDDHLWVYLRDYRITDNKLEISYEVNGDWKHEHRRFSNYIMPQCCNDFNFVIEKQWKSDVEDNGTDTYWSTHHFIIRSGRNKSLITDGLVVEAFGPFEVGDSGELAYLASDGLSIEDYLDPEVFEEIEPYIGKKATVKYTDTDTLDVESDFYHITFDDGAEFIIPRKFLA